MSWAYDFSSCTLPIYSRHCWWNILTDQVHINPPVEYHVTLILKLCYKVIKSKQHATSFFFFFFFLLDSYHVKTSCTSFGSSYGWGKDVSKTTTTKAEHTSFIVLFFLSSDTRQPFNLEPYMFWVIQFFCSQVWLETSKERSINCTQINKKKKDM